MKPKHMLSGILAISFCAGIYACKTPGGQSSQVKNRRENTSHKTGPFYVDGEFDLAKDVIPGRYKNVPVNRFGTVTPLGVDGQPLKMRDGREKVVRDLHYPLEYDPSTGKPLPNGKTGLRLIPVVDGAVPGKTADGTPVNGSELMDNFLRKEMGLGPKDPIFAVIGYMHPEMHRGNFTDLAQSMLKLENGQTHLGAYIGNGQTRNAPLNYHNNQWEVKGHGVGYPANVSIISLEGVPQKVINQNAIITLRLLNESNGGVKFPGDYKNDLFKAINLKETLSFYRDWLLGNPRLSERDEFTYCAEHITIAVNTALNLPQNEKGYIEIWGEQEGKNLWAEAKKKYEAIAHTTMPEVPDFEPLWKRDDKERSNPVNRTELGGSLAWPAETTADLVSDFIGQYADWPDVGAPMSAMLTLGFGPTARDRMGISLAEYLGKVSPIITQMFLAEAMTMPFKQAPDPNAAFDDYVKKSLGGFAMMTDKIQPQWISAERTAPNLKSALIPQIESALKEFKATIKDPVSVDQAWDNFDKQIKKDLEVARETDVAPPSRPGQSAHVKYYSPPAVIHRIINGLHPSHPAVKIRTVATAIDAGDVVKKQGAGMTSYDVYQQ